MLDQSPLLCAIIIPSFMAQLRGGVECPGFCNKRTAVSLVLLQIDESAILNVFPAHPAGQSNPVKLNNLCETKGALGPIPE